MSTFAFIPRSVKRKRGETSGNPSVSTSSPAHPQSQVSSAIPSTSSSAGAQIAKEEHSNGGHVNVKGKKRRDTDKDSSRTPLGASNIPIRPSDPVDSSAASSSRVPDPLDLVALVSLALSDYSLWADVDLRRKIDWSSGAVADTRRETEGATTEQNLTATHGDHGYIPLAYLFRHSSAFRSVSSSSAFCSQPETAYVKALRAHAPEIINVRLIVSPDPSTSLFSKNWSSVGTGYEVRRQVVACAQHGKAEWDRLTVYMENIPIQHRTLPGTVNFVGSLLCSSSDPPSTRLARVQHISFPPHHKDQPGAIPVCKGFALVTLSHKTDIEKLLKDWPWYATPGNQQFEGDEEVAMDLDANQSVTERKAAQQFGLRVLSKARWEELKAEYLLYRQQLVDELNRFQDEADDAQRRDSGVSKLPTPSRTTDDINIPVIDSREAKLGPECSRAQAPKPETAAFINCHTAPKDLTQPSPSIHPGSRYPPGCLVFVRNVHPETNKTTLRTLFSQAWRVTTGTDGGRPDNAVDYVDYTKNMDTCHIRLSTPSHGAHLVKHFATHPTVQNSGLDAAGTPLAEDQLDSKPVLPELVLGKREELYWDKVPEKVRSQAVGKALKLLRADQDQGSGPNGEKNENAGGRRKKPRRK